MTRVYPGDQEEDTEDDGGRVQQSKLNKKKRYYIKFSAYSCKDPKHVYLY